MVLAAAAAVGLALPATMFGSLVALLRVMEKSVGLSPPTPEMLNSENHQNHALFRHVPALSKSLAWRELGDFPTPVHRATVGEDLQFQVKR